MPFTLGLQFWELDLSLICLQVRNLRLRKLNRWMKHPTVLLRKNEKLKVLVLIWCWNCYWWSLGPCYLWLNLSQCPLVIFIFEESKRCEVIKKKISLEMLCKASGSWWWGNKSLKMLNLLLPLGDRYSLRMPNLDLYVNFPGKIIFPVDFWMSERASLLLSLSLSHLDLALLSPMSVSTTSVLIIRIRVSAMDVRTTDGWRILEHWRLYRWRKRISKQSRVVSCTSETVINGSLRTTKGDTDSGKSKFEFGFYKIHAEDSKPKITFITRIFQHVLIEIDLLFVEFVSFFFFSLSILLNFVREILCEIFVTF